MPVTLWPTGLEITDEQATRLDNFVVAMMLSRYRDLHNGEDPPGWPSQLAHRTLAEWSIEHLTISRVRAWERDILENSVTVPEW